MNTYETWSVAGTCAGAVATFLAACVALFIGFKDTIRKWRFPVRIHVGWENREPNAQITAHRGGMTRPEQVMFRLEIVNIGRTEAQDVQIVIESLEQETPPDQGVIIGFSWSSLPGFVPVCLKWTHLNQARLDFFPGNTRRYLDFGLWEWHQTQAHPVLNLATEVGLGMGGSTLRSGKYRCQIAITGRDGMFYRALWGFEFEERALHLNESGIGFIGFKMQLEKLMLGNNEQRDTCCSTCAT